MDVTLLGVVLIGIGLLSSISNVSAQTNLSSSSENKEVFFSDGSRIINLSNNTGYSLAPSLATNGSAIYVVWNQWTEDKQLSDIIFIASYDNGTTWSQQVQLSVSGNHFFSSPELTADGNAVYVLWDNNLARPEEGGDYFPQNVFFRSSQDGGIAWSPIMNLTSNASAELNFATDVEAVASNVSVIWETSGMELVLRASGDAGMNWSEPVIIDKLPGNFPLEESELEKEGEDVLVVYTDESGKPVRKDVNEAEARASFFVVPESPVGAIAMSIASVAALAGYFYIRSKT